MTAVQVEPPLAGGGPGQFEAGGQGGEEPADRPVSSGLASAATTGARGRAAAGAGPGAGGAGGPGGAGRGTGGKV